MLGLPEAFLWKPTQSSSAVAWFFSSHLRQADAAEKKRGSSLAMRRRYGRAPEVSPFGPVSVLAMGRIESRLEKLVEIP
jgi:hypothetical protein